MLIRNDQLSGMGTSWSPGPRNYSTYFEDAWYPESAYTLACEPTTYLLTIVNDEQATRPTMRTGERQWLLHGALGFLTSRLGTVHAFPAIFSRNDRLCSLDWPC